MSADLTAPGLTPEPPHCVKHVGDWGGECAVCNAVREAYIAQHGEWTIGDTGPCAPDADEGQDVWQELAGVSEILVTHLGESSHSTVSSHLEAALVEQSARLTALEAENERLEGALERARRYAEYWESQAKLHICYACGDSCTCHPEGHCAESLGEHPREVTPKSTEHTDNG